MTQMADPELVTLRTFFNHVDADLAKSLLDSMGIESLISADDAGGSKPGLWASSGVRLLVRRQDAELAATIIEPGPLR
jgi:hypothetical protein